MQTKSLLIATCILFSAWGCSSKKKAPKPAPEATPAALTQAPGETSVADVKAEPPKSLVWNYEDTSKWAGLAPENVMCGKGLEQSPVDLKWSKPVASKDIGFFFVAGVFQIEAHPQKIQLTFAKGSHTMIDGEKWNLVAMQVHTPAEHTFSKKQFPLEVHLVHYNEAKTRLGVVAVVFKEGRPNLGIETLLEHMPTTLPGRTFVDNNPLNPSLFLPLANTHYGYSGSLSFPPCTEAVSWVVLNTPLEVSKEQLVKLQKTLKPNARKAQPWNHRKPVNYN